MKVNDIIDNRFKIISFIDEGGTALVYKAFDIIRKRDVALKVILQNISENEDYLTCFNIEASVLANFRHMNIVKIYSFGQYEGRPYIAYEFLNCPTLSSYIERKGSFKYEETLLIMKQILEGIKYVHKSNIVHCDIKPQNIFYGFDGIVKVCDFGISNVQSKLVKQDKIHGSIHYLAPEVIQGNPPSFRSDIYALGITFFELLTGKLPFNEIEFKEVAKAHLLKPFPSLDSYCPTLSLEVESIILKACSKNPLDRYKSVEEMLHDINNIKEPYKKEKKSFWKKLFARREK